MNLLNVPILGTVLKSRIKPWESYGFWDQYCPGFSAPFRDLCDYDVTLSAERDIKRALERVVGVERNQLIIKITGWPRVGYLKKLYPQSKFLHVIRDPRAVINSRLNEGFWTGWGGVYRWSRGELNENDAKIWKEHKKSFVALVCLEYNMLLRSYKKAVEGLNSNQYCEIYYENLCENPREVYNEVLYHLDLPNGKEFFNSLKKYTLKNTNYKWKENFTQEQIEIIESILKESLEYLGYT